MHLLESAAERAFFEAGAASAMAGFFDRMGIAYGDMPASPLAAAQLLAQFPGRRLLVHLTEASEAELATLSQDPNNYFCLCPRANRFIHGREPEYQRFDLAGGRVCIGTDSLAGNGSLDILAELQAIRAAAPTIPSAYLLHCATQNGAAALGWAGSLGQLRAGTAPGLNQLAPLGPQGELLPETELQVLYPAAPPGA
jgi:cytosine/adenosine deaminase-related metal-dependent hydrolase